MEKLHPIKVFRSRYSGKVEELASDVRDHWQKRWRNAYGAPHQATFGAGDLEGYDWHLFSFKVHPSIEGADALAAFTQRAGAVPLIAIPSYLAQYTKLPGLRLVPGPLKEAPALGGLRTDYLLFPESLGWTYACTHEDGYIGPFFATL